MANVGSVELSLILDRSSFDKELRSLSTLEIPPLNLDLKLDAKSLNKQLKDLKNGDYGCLELEICPDIKGLSRKLKELPKSLVDCIPVAICPEFDTESLRKQFDSIKDEFSVSVQTAINAAIKVSAAAEAKQGEAANRGANAASQKIEAGFGKAAERINTAIDTALKNAGSLITSPFKSILRGAFEGIGQNLTRELSNSAVSSFQKALDVSFKSVGGNAGGVAAREVGKALGLETIPKRRAKKKDDDESSGGTKTERKSPKPSSPTESNSLKELSAIASGFGAFSDSMKRAGLGGDKFGESAIKAAKETLELIAAFQGLRQGIQKKPQSSTPGATSTPKPNATGATPDTKATEPKATGATTEPMTKRGFLIGDTAKISKEEVNRQLNSVRSAIDKKLVELQSLPKSPEVQGQIKGLIANIGLLNSRIATDIANPAIPEAARRSLAALKGVKSRLSQTEANAKKIGAEIDAEVKKIEESLRGKDSSAKFRTQESQTIPLKIAPTPPSKQASAFGLRAKLATLGGIGATISGAGSAQAAGTGASALGLSALPFDPTLGLAAGGLAAAFAAAKFTPRILRRVGASKAADVLETDVGKIAADTIKGVFSEVNSSVKKSFRAFGKRFERFVGLNDPRSMDDLPAKSRPNPNLDINLRGNRQRQTVADVARLPSSRPTPTATPIAAPLLGRLGSGTASPQLPAAPPNYWDRFFRGLEARFYRSPLFSGNVSPRDRRNLTSEATGFLASGSLLAAPGATGIALGAPLLAALTPLIATVGLVANAIGPLVGNIANTLKEIQPLQSRFEFIGGGKAQGEEQQQFVRGITDELNIPVLSSLESFSKLAAAARKTKLEGQPLRDLFEGIATGAKGLQLNTQDLNLVMFAFTQVLSKGKLSAEEVRLQIAERLPGAVGIFARAIGVTEAEFNKLLESGSLLAQDVLPKVGRQLKEEYGAAAAAASNTFVSALTKVENAVFKLKEGFATGLAPILTIVTDTFGNVINFLANNAKTIFSTLSVVLIGVSAQFFVGLTQILEASGLVAKLTGFLTPLFARVFATLTPFAIGIAADFLDDILGTQTSVFDNLQQGAYKAVLGTILVLDGFKTKITDFFSSLGENEFLSEVFRNVAIALTEVGKALGYVQKFLGSTVTEFVALSLILAQTYVLLRQGLNLVLARLGTTIAQLGASFIATAKSGKVFQSVMSTLTAGLKSTELVITGLTAVLILFFSKADFSNELGSKFDDLGNKIADNFNKIAEATKNVNSEFDKLSPPDFKSKGFDVTLGLGDLFGTGAFRTDDIIKFSNAEEGKIGFKNLKTIGEKQFEDNVIKVNELSTKSNNSVNSILSNFDSTEAGKNLAQIKRFDEQIRLISERRAKLLNSPLANTDEVKKQVADIDSLIDSFLKKRSEIVKPVEVVRDSVLNNLSVLQQALNEVNLRTDIPESAKQQLRNPLLAAISIAESAKKRLEELGAIDLSPLGNQFTDITIAIEKSDRALEKTLSKIGLNTIKRQTKTATDLGKGLITPDIAARENTDTELSDLKSKSRTLTDFIKSRRQAIGELQTIPSPTLEQTETINKYTKDVESKELELATNRLQIANKIVEGKKQAEGRILKDFQTANAQASAVVQKAEQGRTSRAKRNQLNGKITDEQAQVEIQDAGVTAAKGDLQIAQNAIVEFQKIKKTGILSTEEITARELELNKQLSDAILRSLDAEISKRDSLKQKRIADLEELRTKEQAGIDVNRTNAGNKIKQQQLAGTITPDGATNANTEAEIAAALGSLTIARKRLDDVKKLRAEGTLNAKEAATKEREAIASVAAAEGQILDLRLQKQQQFREQNLRKIEEANNRAISLIDQQQAEADKRVSLTQSLAPVNEETDRKAERDRASNQRDATRIRITQAQKEISQLSRANFETEAEYTAKRTELEIGLTRLTTQGLDERRDLEKRNQDDAIRAIQRRLDIEKSQSDLAIAGIEDQKSAQELLNSSIDRSRELLESRSNLARAIADSRVVAAEIALEGADESERQQLSLNLQNAKLEALRQEQEAARELLRLDQKRQAVQAELQKGESEIALLRSQQARLEAIAALSEAQVNRDERTINLALTRLEITEKQVALSEKQLQNAKKAVLAQSELSSNAQKTLDVQQRSALSQAEAARIAAAKVKVEPSNDTRSVSDNTSNSSDSASAPALSLRTFDTSEKKPKKLSLFEQSRLNMFAPLPTQKNVGLPPEYFNLKAVTQKVPTTSTGAGTLGMSAEAELNAALGLLPGETTENLLKRQLGLSPDESVESYLKKPMSLFYGQDRSGSFQSLNQKYPAKNSSLQELGQMYAPKITSFEELNQKYKPMSETLDDLNKKFAPTEPNTAQFSDALKSSVKGLEERLDRLNGTLAAAVNSPRNLYVSSPEPVTDAVSILADINRMNIQSSGLG
ncbi:MAG: tape measure protein [Chroococcidiopsis sp.]